MHAQDLGSAGEDSSSLLESQLTRRMYLNTTMSVLRPNAIERYQTQMPRFEMQKETMDALTGSVVPGLQKEAIKSHGEDLLEEATRVKICTASTASELALQSMSVHTVDMGNQLVWHGGPCLLDLCWYPFLSMTFCHPSHAATLEPAKLAPCATAALLTCGSTTRDIRLVEGERHEGSGVVYLWHISFELPVSSALDYRFSSIGHGGAVGPVCRIELVDVASSAITSLKWLPFSISSTASMLSSQSDERHTLLAALCNHQGPESQSEVLIFSFPTLACLFPSQPSQSLHWKPVYRIRLERHAFTCFEWSQHPSCGVKLLAGTREGMIAIYDLAQPADPGHAFLVPVD